MAEVPRVPLGHPPAGSWLPGVAGTVLVILALAVVKPWAPPGRAPAAATPFATFYNAPTATERTGPRPYDPRLFGGREPDPAWELWPAGYVVQFGMAGPVRVHGQDGASPGPSASAAVSALPSDPAGTAAPTGPPLPENVVDLGPSDHLVALGINTPLEVRVERVELWIFRGDGCCQEQLPLVNLPTLWESAHFYVIAPEDSAAPGQPAAWDSGLYRLDLVEESGEIREVLLLVRPPQG